MRRLPTPAPATGEGEGILPDAKRPRSTALPASGNADAPPSGVELSALVRADWREASRALAALAPERVVELVLQLDPKEREPLLALIERPADVVPLLPEHELVTTLRETGLADAGWLLEFATPEQRIAGVDLDVWRDVRLSQARLAEWIDALIEAGDDTLGAALDELDPELWILALKEMADFHVLGDGERPDGLRTEDGLIWWEPRGDADEERVRTILRAGGWHLAWCAAFDEEDDVEQWAHRFRSGRLNDLGFPDHERAMDVYRPLRIEDATIVDAGPGDGGVQVVEAREQRGSLVRQALSQLPAARASEVTASILSVANALAVADELPLSESASLRQSLAKALFGIELGLQRVVRAQGLVPDRALDDHRALDLFRIGVTLEPKLGRAKTLEDLDLVDDDWAVELFVFDPDNP